MYTSAELIDSIITEQQELFKALIIGNYPAFCTIYADVVSKLAALRKGVESDAEAKKKEIDALKARLNELTEQTQVKGAKIIGGEIVEIDMNEDNGEAQK